MKRQGILIQTRVFRAIRVSTSSVKKKCGHVETTLVDSKCETRIQMNTFSYSSVTKVRKVKKNDM